MYTRSVSYTVGLMGSNQTDLKILKILYRFHYEDCHGIYSITIVFWSVLGKVYCEVCHGGMIHYVFVSIPTINDYYI